MMRANAVRDPALERRIYWEYSRGADHRDLFTSDRRWKLDDRQPHPIRVRGFGGINYRKDDGKPTTMCLLYMILPW